jgi:hypothetical protein
LADVPFANIFGGSFAAAGIAPRQVRSGSALERTRPAGSPWPNPRRNVRFWHEAETGEASRSPLSERIRYFHRPDLVDRLCAAVSLRPSARVKFSGSTLQFGYKKIDQCTDSRRVSQVRVNAQFDGLGRLRKRRFEPDERWPSIRQNAWQHSHCLSRFHRSDMRLDAVRSQDHVGSWRDRLQPRDMDDLDGRLDERCDDVSCAPVCKLRSSVPAEIVERRIKTIGNVGNFALDQILLIEHTDTYGDISLATREIEAPGINLSGRS